MKPLTSQLLKWELARERFQIEDRFPPRQPHQEKHIREILSNILQTEVPEEPMLPPIIVERWPLIAGRQLALHVRPAQMKNTTLTFYADHPGWLAESRRLPKMQILKKIVSIGGLPEIKEIRFQLDPAIRTGQPRK